MPSIKSPITAVASVALLAAVAPLFGCRQSTSPAAPTSAAPTPAASPATDTAGVTTLSSSSLTSLKFVTDSVVQGSEAQLTGFDGSVLAFNTTKGAFTALFDNNTVFRNAQISKYQPTDPCRQFAIDYNTGGLANDAGTLFGAITSMATNKCLGRIAVDKTIPSDPHIPPNPVKSFRPLATF